MQVKYGHVTQIGHAMLSADGTSFVHIRWKKDGS